MQEIVNCPSCQRKLQVPESLLGQDVQCPTCGATFVAALGGQTAPPPPAPRYEEEFSRREKTERPRYHDDHDDDYEDRPRRRRRDLMPHRGVMILVFGILSWVVCPIFGIMAWVMGNGDLVEIKSGRMDPEGEGLTQAGKVVGMISVILWCVGLLFYCIIIILAVAAGGMR
jgi:hypothetical protein